MSTWVTHLMVADRVVQQVPYLSKHEFFVGNIAPDCNVKNSAGLVVETIENVSK